MSAAADATGPQDTSPSSDDVSMVDTELMAIWTQSRSIDEQLAKESLRGPEAAAAVTELRDLLDKKLYHEMTDTLLNYIESRIRRNDGREAASVSTRMVPPIAETLMYIGLPVLNRMNPKRIVSILWEVSELSLHPEDAIILTERFADKLAGEDAADALVMCNSLKAYLLVDVDGKKKAAEDSLEEIKKELELRHGIALEAHAAFHRTYAKLAKHINNPDMFYEHACLYVSYISLESLSLEVRKSLAFDTAAAALNSKTVFSFGELYQQPLLSALNGTAEEWMLELIVIFREGKLEDFNKFLLTEKAFHSCEEFKGKESGLRRKLTLLAFIDLCFSRPKQKLSLIEIAEHCCVAKDDVEVVAMEAMSRKLMTGSIDEVEGTVQVTWVKPRVLDNARLEVMRQRLDNWAGAAQSLLSRLDEQSIELTTLMSTVF